MKKPLFIRCDAMLRALLSNGQAYAFNVEANDNSIKFFIFLGLYFKYFYVGSISIIKKFTLLAESCFKVPDTFFFKILNNYFFHSKPFCDFVLYVSYIFHF